MSNFGEQFLHQKDPKLLTSDVVEHEQKRKKIKGEQTSSKPADKISDFMEVLEKTHLSHNDDERVLDRIKNYYHKEYVIKDDEVPQSYFDNQKRIMREQGYGDIEISQDQKKQLIDVIQSDQRSTLDNWINYFTSKDSNSFPMWAKYWAFNGMTKLSSYDKEKHKFNNRDKGTVAPFADLDREALAYVIDAIIKKAKNENIPLEQEDPEFKKLLSGANFGKLYAYAIEKVTPARENELENTSGEWIKYNQGSDHMPLVKSLQGHGTGWCTAGENTAQTQLQGGDFYVYYSYDKDGKPTIPRVAIRMQGNQIGEVRGIAKEQNIDTYIGDVVNEKLKQFPDGELYHKKVDDMKRLTEIDKKSKSGQELDKDDLIFLYEIDSPIEGFGYSRDPRIDEIISTRNPKQDAPIVFDCEPQEIAWSEEERDKAIKNNKTPKAYIGPLFPNIFEKLDNVEYIYTCFPKGKIERVETTIGGKSKEQIISELGERANSDDTKEKIYLSSYAKNMCQSLEFTTLEKLENTKLVKLKVSDLGFSDSASLEQIYTKAKELGLELCLPEVGPNLRLNYKEVFKREQPKGEWLRIAMKQITDSDGHPRIFHVLRDDDGEQWLYFSWTVPGDMWGLRSEFVFSRK